MSTSEQLAADLKNTGLKVTIPRIKVLTIFEQSKTRHLSAEDVYKQIFRLQVLLYKVFFFLILICVPESIRPQKHIVGINF